VNQDFIMQGSPGMARNIVKLAKFCKINLDPAIIEMANTGYVDLEDTSFSETDRAVIQNIIDYDFRCIFPTLPDAAPKLVAYAAKICGISPILILSRGLDKAWTSAFAAEGYKFEEDLFVINPVKIKKTGLENDFLRDKRQGLLIVDDLAPGDIRTHAQDFPKTIIVTHRRLVTDMGDYVNVLFEKAPGQILTRNALMKRRMATMGFDEQAKPMEFAFMFKILTEHLVELEQDSAVDRLPLHIYKEAQVNVYGDLDDDLAF
jgi:hypothetical protein